MSENAVWVLLGQTIGTLIVVWVIYSLSTWVLVKVHLSRRGPNILSWLLCAVLLPLGVVSSLGLRMALIYSAAGTFWYIADRRSWR